MGRGEHNEIALLRFNVTSNAAMTDGKRLIVELSWVDNTVLEAVISCLVE